MAESDPLHDWPLAVAFLIVGGGVGFLVVWALTRHTRRTAHEQAAELIEVARREAAVAAEEMKQKVEGEIQEKRAELNREFDRREIESDVRLREIRAHEESLALLDYQLEQRQERLNRESAAVKQARDAIRALSKSVRKRLEGVSQLDAEEIRKQLREEVMLECQDEFRALRRATLEKSEQELQNEARRILIASMQRIASKPNNDLTATIVQLPSEEMKGRIIGREGRNIKSFESATGVTLLIDESPQMVLISSFDPVRREIARVALEGLVKDGRIHPASIEEFVKRAQEEIELVTTQAGEDAVARLNINGLHPEIIKLLGRLKYRFSYNQNVLDHSIETAFLASVVASEVGLDPNVAKRAGLLHDRQGRAGRTRGQPCRDRGGVHQALRRDADRRQRRRRAPRGGETGNRLRGLGHPRRHHLGCAAGRAGGVDDGLHPAAGPAREAGVVTRGRAAGVRDPGRTRDPCRGFTAGSHRRPRPRNREGSPQTHRGRVAVSEHDQDHGHPGVAFH